VLHNKLDLRILSTVVLDYVMTLIVSQSWNTIREENLTICLRTIRKEPLSMITSCQHSNGGEIY